MAGEHGSPSTERSCRLNKNVLAYRYSMSMITYGVEGKAQGKQARRAQEGPAGTPALRFQPGFGVGMARGPIFRREGHVPKSRIGQQKLHTHLDLPARKVINVRDDTL